MNSKIEEQEAVASVIYNMGVKGLGKKYAVGTLTESVEEWEKRLLDTLSKKIEGKKVSPVYYDQHGAPMNEDDLVKNRIIDGILTIIRKMK